MSAISPAFGLLFLNFARCCDGIHLIRLLDKTYPFSVFIKGIPSIETLMTKGDKTKLLSTWPLVWFCKTCVGHSGRKSHFLVFFL